MSNCARKFGPSSKFSMLVRMSSGQLKFDVIREFPSDCGTSCSKGQSYQSIEWEHAVCDVTIESEEEDKVTSADVEIDLSSASVGDIVCLQTVDLVITMSDGNIPFTDVEVNSLLDMWSCYLTDILSLDIRRSYLAITGNEGDDPQSYWYTSIHQVKHDSVERLIGYSDMTSMTKSSSFLSIFLDDVALARAYFHALQSQDCTRDITRPIVRDLKTDEAPIIEFCWSVLPDSCIVDWNMRMPAAPVDEPADHLGCINHYKTVFVKSSAVCMSRVTFKLYLCCYIFLSITRLLQ